MSIVGLVIVIRIFLIPLFVKQIHAQRRMQLSAANADVHIQIVTVDARTELSCSALPR